MFGIILCLGCFDGGVGTDVPSSKAPHSKEVRTIAKELSLQCFLEKIDGAKPLTNYAAQWSPDLGAKNSLEQAVVAVLRVNNMDSLAEEFEQKASECEDKIDAFCLALEYVTFDLAAIKVMSSVKSLDTEKNKRFVADQARNEPISDEEFLPGGKAFQEFHRNHQSAQLELVKNMEKGDIYSLDFKTWRVVTNRRSILKVDMVIHGGPLSDFTHTFPYNTLIASNVKLVSKSKSVTRAIARKARVLAHKFGFKKDVQI